MILGVLIRPGGEGKGVGILKMNFFIRIFSSTEGIICSIVDLHVGNRINYSLENKIRCSFMMHIMSSTVKHLKSFVGFSTVRLRIHIHDCLSRIS